MALDNENEVLDEEETLEDDETEFDDTEEETTEEDDTSGNDNQSETDDSHEEQKTDNKDDVKEKNRKGYEQRKSKDNSPKDDDFIKNDLTKFAEEYPDVNVKELLGDKEFLKYADKRLGKESLSQLKREYDIKNEAFKEAEKQYQEELKKQTELMRKRANSSSGSLKTPSPKEAKKSYSEMSKEEFNAEFERIKRIPH